MNTHTISLQHKLLFGSLYTTQSIGLGFLMVALIGILRDKGVSLEDLSIVYVLGIPWTLKFLWAPLIDRFGSRYLGHYRGWVLGLQALMVVLLVYLASCSLDTQFNAVLIGGLLLSLASASQDVAVDAIASSQFSHRQRGVINGIQSGGALLGYALGGGVILMLYPYIGWAGSFYLMAAITTVSLLQVMFFRERHICSTDDPSSIAAAFKSLLFFWRGKGFWLLLIIISSLGYSAIYSILTPLLIDAGKSLSDVGMILNVFGMGVGVFCGIFAGIVIQRFGRKKAMRYLYVFQVFVFTVILPVGWNSSEVMLYIACIAYFTTYPMIAAMLSTLMMDYASQHVTPGADYSIQYAVTMLSGMVIGGVAMQLADAFGYTIVIAMSVVIAVVALLLVYRYTQELPLRSSSEHAY